MAEESIRSLKNGRAKSPAAEMVLGGHQQQQQPRLPSGRQSSKSKMVCCRLLEELLVNLRHVLLGTKLAPLFLIVPVAVAANYFGFGLKQAWVFSLSLLGLAPLAERVSFLSEQIAYYAGPTVGGLLNATCGNAPELIIALLALHRDKLEVLKWSLLGSILSNLLLVLGSSLFFGGLANLNKERPFDRKQADVSLNLLLLASLCYSLVFIFPFSVAHGKYKIGFVSVLELSRLCSIIMLIAYFGCLFFQLRTHRQLFETQDDDNIDDNIFSDAPVIGFASACVWIIGMTAMIAILSDYVVNTIEATSESWNLSVSFISIILLPIVGNAAEHAGALIFAFKNKIDITLGVSLGSSTQISMFLVPLTTIVAWIKGVHMDLNFKLIETISLVMAILMTTIILQGHHWHYMKGSVLFLCYIAIGTLFFLQKPPLYHATATDIGAKRNQ